MYKRQHKVLVYIHDRGIVIEVSTVVFGAEYGNKLLILSKEPVAIFHDLMASANQVKVVVFKELFQLLFAEHKPTASLIFFPAMGIFIWVIPEEVGDETTVWYVGGFRNFLYLIEATHIFGDTTVHAHDLFINKGNKWHVVETIPEGLPKSNFVSSLNLVEKSIDSGDSL